MGNYDDTKKKKKIRASALYYKMKPFGGSIPTVPGFLTSRTQIQVDGTLLVPTRSAALPTKLRLFKWQPAYPREKEGGTGST